MMSCMASFAMSSSGDSIAILQMKSIPARSNRSTHWENQLYIYIFASLDINAGFSLSILLRTSKESHTNCVPCRLRRWSLRFTFSKKVLKRLNPVRHDETQRKLTYSKYHFMQLHRMVLMRAFFCEGKISTVPTVVSCRCTGCNTSRYNTYLMWNYCGFKWKWWVIFVAEILPFIVIS